MSNTVTIIGNLTADPELRFTPSGQPVANFTVADTPRYRTDSGEWKDGVTTFLRCNVWGNYAENVAESLTVGVQVIVQGALVQRSFETREGEKRTVTELRVSAVGPTLRYATAKVNKVSRAIQTADEDPWGSPPPVTDDQLDSAAAGR